MTDGALAGLRVIDAATLAAGPLITTWMGEYGPEVIKVEQPDVEERGPQQEVRHPQPAARGGRGLLRSLTRQADVVVMNLPRQRCGSAACSGGSTPARPCASTSASRARRPINHRLSNRI